MSADNRQVWLLPPNPGPFGTLEQWRTWRQYLERLGASTPGADVELQIAENVIAQLEKSPTDGA